MRALLLLVLSLVTLGSPAVAQPLYVDADAAAGGDGASWATAFDDLQDALAAAGASTEIWIAEGTYVPGTASGDAFDLPDGVALYGGFDGTETLRTQRDPAVHLTVLSGEIGTAAATDNSTHVVTLTWDTATLDGLTIADGYAADATGFPTPSNSGAGLLCDSGATLTLRDVTFAGNRANYGGGLMSDTCILTLDNVRFLGNTASNAAGSDGRGGGFYFHDTPATMAGLFVAGNVATTNGGGGYVGGGTTVLANSVFTSNATDLSGTVFPASGGGLVFSADSGFLSPIAAVHNTVFYGNAAFSTGGGLFVTGGDVGVYNSLFRANSAGASTSDPGAQYREVFSTIGGSLGALQFYASNVENGVASVNQGDAGNTDADPLFLDPDGADATPGTLDDDFRLAAGSPAIDAGIAGYLPPDALDVDRDGDTAEALPLDLDGLPRVADAQVEQGPYETAASGGTHLVSGTVFFDDDLDGTQDPGERGVAGIVVRLAPGPHYALTDADGQFQITADAGSYTLDLPNPPAYHTVVPGAHAVLLTGPSGSDTGNGFALQSTGTTADLSVTLSAGPPPRPGFDHLLFVDYCNVGTTTQSGTVTVDFDAAFSFIAATPTADAQSGTSLDFDYAPLLPGACRRIGLVLRLAPDVALLGTDVLFSAVISPTAGDETPENNLATLVQTVVGAYDPNDKRVSETALTEDAVQAGHTLTYTVRFQNVGTAEAIHVRIEDDLDETTLDLTTFAFVAASHTVTGLTLDADGRLVVRFDNINLAAEQDDEPGSHGFIRFTIQPFTTLTLGDTIENFADIFFDFNPAIRTNTVRTDVGAHVVRAQSRIVGSTAPFAVPILLESDVAGAGVIAYELTVGYDDTYATFTGVDTDGTRSATWQTAPASVAAAMAGTQTTALAQVFAASTTPLAGPGLLVYLLFTPTGATGTSALDLTAVFNEGTPAVFAIDGILEVRTQALGDVTGNGTVSAADATLVLGALAGTVLLDAAATQAADVDGDGRLTAHDAALILQHSAGLRLCFPPESGCASG